MFYSDLANNLTLFQMSVNLRSRSKMTLGDENFFARDFFPSGLLPTARMVVEVMLWHLLPKGKGYICPKKEEAAAFTANMLMEHWVWCNVYPTTKVNTAIKIEKLYKEFHAKCRTPKARQTEKWKEETARPYVQSLEKGLDIRTKDDTARKRLEEHFGVKETATESEYWTDQMHGDRKMFCESFVDRKWQALHDRKTTEKAAQGMMMMQQQVKIDGMKKVPLPKDIEEELMSVSEEEKEETDTDFLEEEDEDKTGKKKRKLVHETTDSGSLPEGYNHVRRSIGKVSTEH